MKRNKKIRRRNKRSVTDGFLRFPVEILSTGIPCIDEKLEKGITPNDLKTLIVGSPGTARIDNMAKMINSASYPVIFPLEYSQNQIDQVKKDVFSLIETAELKFEVPDIID